MSMKTMTVGEFKAHFSDVIDQVKAGEQIEVTYGRKKEVVGYFKPVTSENLPKRKLGLLKGKGEAIFMPDFKMDETDFLKK